MTPMPIYEFYCPDCHTVFSFFSSAVDTAASPACPRCSRPGLGRRPSRFAAITASAKKDDQAEESSPFDNVDETRLERAMDSLASEMEGLSDTEAENPRHLARFFRKFGEASGLQPGPKMEEMLRRLEKGEDPDALEEEYGGDPEASDEDMLGDLFQLKKQAQARRSKRPAVDDTLYFL
jgi:putative FmdB family regulatory protein